LWEDIETGDKVEGVNTDANGAFGATTTDTLTRHQIRLRQRHIVKDFPQLSMHPALTFHTRHLRCFMLADGAGSGLIHGFTLRSFPPQTPVARNSLPSWAHCLVTAQPAHTASAREISGSLAIG
jgi:hypothetical protein